MALNWSVVLIFAFSAKNAYTQCPYSSMPSSYLSSSQPQCAAIPTNCQNSVYRSIDGSCNNLYNPGYGMANTIFNRLLPARYGDNLFSLTTSLNGGYNPSSRLLSTQLFGEKRIFDQTLTAAIVDFGQFTAHDTSTSSLYTNPSVCCTNRNAPLCSPIDIPKNDKIVLVGGSQPCMEFSRHITNKQSCPVTNDISPAEQMNSGTSFLDMDPLYGKSNVISSSLRSYKDGLLKANINHNEEWLPRFNDARTCPKSLHKGGVCYQAGDIRQNMTPQLSVLSTVLLREHNRIARALAKLRPSFSDEQLFQEARKINIAQYQQIVYYEYLPILVGRDNLLETTVIHNQGHNDKVNDYNPTINPSTLNAFGNGAYRYYHNLIYGQQYFVNRNNQVSGTIRISDYFNDPGLIEVGDNLESLARGNFATNSKLPDKNIDPEVKDFLQKLNKLFGIDLKAFDIERNRDHGLATYNDYRALAGLKRAYNWEGYLDVISPDDIAKLKTIYGSHEDCDLSVCGALEKHIPGSITGPTFTHIVTEQFYRYRVGDRYFFENGQNNFSTEQVREIRKASLARLFCDNTGLNQIQSFAFFAPDKYNQVVSCNRIPSVDLTRWKTPYGYSPSSDYKTIMLG